MRLEEESRDTGGNEEADERSANADSSAGVLLGAGGLAVGVGSLVFVDIVLVDLSALRLAGVGGLGDVLGSSLVVLEGALSVVGTNFGVRRRARFFYISGKQDLRVDHTSHATLAVTASGAVEPDGVGILDGDGEEGLHEGGSLNGHEAGEETSRVAGARADGRARAVKAGLSDRVVLEKGKVRICEFGKREISAAQLTRG